MKGHPSRKDATRASAIFALACLGTMLVACGVLIDGGLVPSAAEVLQDTTLSAATATAAMMVLRT